VSAKAIVVVPEPLLLKFMVTSAGAAAWKVALMRPLAPGTSTVQVGVRVKQAVVPHEVSAFPAAGVGTNVALGVGERSEQVVVPVPGVGARAARSRAALQRDRAGTGHVDQRLEVEARPDREGRVAGRAEREPCGCIPARSRPRRTRRVHPWNQPGNWLVAVKVTVDPLGRDPPVHAKLPGTAVHCSRPALSENT
jgi:hypothetical protein